MTTTLIFKRCSNCGETKPQSEFNRETKSKDGYKRHCRECTSAYFKMWSADNKGRIRAYKLKAEFGISAEQYQELLTRQHGACAICREACPTGNHLCVDHSHVTGTVRGLLCIRCNTGIGSFKESVSRMLDAVEYLKDWDEGFSE